MFSNANIKNNSKNTEKIFKENNEIITKNNFLNFGNHFNAFDGAHLCADSTSFAIIIIWIYSFWFIVFEFCLHCHVGTECNTSQTLDALVFINDGSKRLPITSLVFRAKLVRNTGNW